MPITLDSPVTIKSIECAIIDRGFKEGWVKPQLPEQRTGKSVAVIGRGFGRRRKWSAADVAGGDAGWWR